MAKKKTKPNHSKEQGNIYQNKIGILLGIGIVIIILFIFAQNKSDSSSNSNVKEVTLSEAGDLIIPLNEVTEEASFYPLEVEGTQLEVLAIKAEDGTVRTAFNTCQICYSSGRGYYVQNGNNLVCQNCGNRFSANDVERVRGGCNPVPIFPENKVLTDENITISNTFLKQTKDIFLNWKNEY